MLKISTALFAKVFAASSAPFNPIEVPPEATACQECDAVPGTAGHSWQGVAAGGTSIGLKGTKLAAQVMADTAQDLFKDPTIIEAAKAEYKQRVGEDFDYYPLLGERDPPLNYRN